MRKKPSLPPRPLPPLSFQALDEVRDVEDVIQDALRDCDDNLERVRQTLHTGVAEKLNVLMKYYFSLPDPQIAWFAQLIPRTVDSIIEMCSALAPGDQFRGELFITAKHHVEQWLGANRNETLTTETAPEPIREKESSRRAFIIPLLDAKGWSILEWAIEAGVVHATAIDYLDNKTAPYRSTRLKLAKALGLPVEQLPK
jgi:lambda repressor-like predicted transcriptional regulator